MQEESSSEVTRLIAELEQAEAYEQRLHQFFVDIRAELAAGRTGFAELVHKLATRGCGCACFLACS